MKNFELSGFAVSDVTLQAVDTFTLWHPFTQMSAYASDSAPIIERGEGIRLIGVDGKRYFDGVSSLWCNVHGHRHPVLDRALHEQIDRIAHSTLLGLGSVPSILLADQLARRTGLEHVFYAEAGAAAVEIALKIAFQYWKHVEPGGRRTKFVAFRNAYHGDTLGSVSVGGIEIFHELFKPLLFEPIFAPAPYPYRAPNREACGAECLEALDELLDEHAASIAAIVIEPLVQGAAGIIVHPSGFLREVRRMANDRGVLLIADEVATGFGRTGSMFACQAENVRPDILVLGKGLTGGYLPLSATLCTGRIFSAFLAEYADFRHFFHGHTYTGNALACAVALASLRVFDDEDVIGGLETKAARIRAELAGLNSHPHVGEIRQKGLMIGIELVANRETKEPFPATERLGHRVVLEARDRGMIIRPLGDVVVFMPPLASTVSELGEMCEILVASIESAMRSRKSPSRP